MLVTKSMDIENNQMENLKIGETQQCDDPASYNCNSCIELTKKNINLRQWLKYFKVKVINIDKFLYILDEYDVEKQKNISLQLAYDQRTREWSQQQEEYIHLLHEVLPLRERLKLAEHNAENYRLENERLQCSVESHKKAIIQLNGQISELQVFKPMSLEYTLKKLQSERKNKRQLKTAIDEQNITINDLRAYISNRNNNFTKICKKIYNSHFSNFNPENETGSTFESAAISEMQRDLFAEADTHLNEQYGSYKNSVTAIQKSNYLYESKIQSFADWVNDYHFVEVKPEPAKSKRKTVNDLETEMLESYFDQVDCSMDSKIIQEMLVEPVKNKRGRKKITAVENEVSVGKQKTEITEYRSKLRSGTITSPHCGAAITPVSTNRKKDSDSKCHKQICLDPSTDSVIKSPSSICYQKKSTKTKTIGKGSPKEVKEIVAITPESSPGKTAISPTSKTASGRKRPRLIDSSDDESNSTITVNEPGLSVPEIFSMFDCDNETNVHATSPSLMRTPPRLDKHFLRKKKIHTVSPIHEIIASDLNLSDNSTPAKSSPKNILSNTRGCSTVNDSVQKKIAGPTISFDSESAAEYLPTKKKRIAYDVRRQTSTIMSEKLTIETSPTTHSVPTENIPDKGRRYSLRRQKGTPANVSLKFTEVVAATTESPSSIDGHGKQIDLRAAKSVFTPTKQLTGKKLATRHSATIGKSKRRRTPVSFSERNESLPIRFSTPVKSMFDEESDSSGTCETRKLSTDSSHLSTMKEDNDGTISPIKPMIGLPHQIRSLDQSGGEASMPFDIFDDLNLSSASSAKENSDEISDKNTPLQPLISSDQSKTVSVKRVPEFALPKKLLNSRNCNKRPIPVLDDLDMCFSRKWSKSRLTKESCSNENQGSTIDKKTSEDAEPSAMSQLTNDFSNKNFPTDQEIDDIFNEICSFNDSLMSPIHTGDESDEQSQEKPVLEEKSLNSQNGKQDSFSRHPDLLESSSSTSPSSVNSKVQLNEANEAFDEICGVVGTDTQDVFLQSSAADNMELGISIDSNINDLVDVEDDLMLSDDEDGGNIEIPQIITSYESASDSRAPDVIKKGLASPPKEHLASFQKSAATEVVANLNSESVMEPNMPLISPGPQKDEIPGVLIVDHINSELVKSEKASRIAFSVPSTKVAPKKRVCSLRGRKRAYTKASALKFTKFVAATQETSSSLHGHTKEADSSTSNNLSILDTQIGDKKMSSNISDSSTTLKNTDCSKQASYSSSFTSVRNEVDVGNNSHSHFHVTKNEGSSKSPTSLGAQSDDQPELPMSCGINFELATPPKILPLTSRSTNKQNLFKDPETIKYTDSNIPHKSGSCLQHVQVSKESSPLHSKISTDLLSSLKESSINVESLQSESSSSQYASVENINDDTNEDLLMSPSSLVMACDSENEEIFNDKEEPQNIFDGKKRSQICEGDLKQDNMIKTYFNIASSAEEAYKKMNQQWNVISLNERAKPSALYVPMSEQDDDTDIKGSKSSDLEKEVHDEDMVGSKLVASHSVATCKGQLASPSVTDCSEHLAEDSKQVGQFRSLQEDSVFVDSLKEQIEETIFKVIVTRDWDAGVGDVTRMIAAQVKQFGLSAVIDVFISLIIMRAMKVNTLEQKDVSSSCPSSIYKMLQIVRATEESLHLEKFSLFRRLITACHNLIIETNLTPYTLANTATLYFCSSYIIFNASKSPTDQEMVEASRQCLIQILLKYKGKCHMAILSILQCARFFLRGKFRGPAQSPLERAILWIFSHGEWRGAKLVLSLLREPLQKYKLTDENLNARPVDLFGMVIKTVLGSPKSQNIMENAKMALRLLFYWNTSNWVYANCAPAIQQFFLVSKDTKETLMPSKEMQNIFADIVADMRWEERTKSNFMLMVKTQIETYHKPNEGDVPT